MSQDDALHLSLDIRGYWIVSAGYGLGALHDEVCVRDPDGLPYVPGRHLRGLLRHAVACQDAAMADVLFGERIDGQATSVGEPEGTVAGGCLRVDSAQLPGRERDWFRHPGHKNDRKLLFRTIYATAVDPDTGTAANRTLRTIEVAVPLKMKAHVSTLAACPGGRYWRTAILQALPLIRALGKHRHGGMGRVVVTEDTP